MAFIEIKNLSFTYPNQQEKAIKDLSLNIDKGEFVVVFGSSGSGKSTLLRNLKTVLTPSGLRNGKILYNEKPLEEIDQRTQSSKIGFVAQSPDNQIVTDKVWHELSFGLESLGFDTSTIRIRVAEMAAFFGIEDWFYKNVNELSGGQKQLLNLASVMTMQPEILVLDEPTAQLDPIASDEFLSALGKINRELGTTIILTEHRLKECFPLSSNAVVMDKGEIIVTGTPKYIGKQLKSKNDSIFLGLPTPMRVWSAVENKFDCPITIAEGREWLENFSKDYTLSSPAKKTYPKINDEVVVKAKDLWFRYEKESEDIIKGLDLEIHKGEFLALMGGNGTGKTTTLKLISGIKKAYRGDVSVKGKISVLPQDPKTLFVEKTVRSDLYEIFQDTKTLKEVQNEKVSYVVTLCKLQDLLDRHPYDLSGGEQQRMALAKVLLTEPDILALDEPTKGFDAEFKILFAKILDKLLKDGVTIFMISHDIEFCAKYACRIAMFFDGNIVTSSTPDAFFSGNSFYTTSANRMARGIIKNTILPEDIITSCGGKILDENELPKHSEPLPEAKEETGDWKPKRLPMWRKMIAAISGIFSLLIFFYATRITDLTEVLSVEGITILGTWQIKIYAVFIISLLVFAFATYRKSKPLTVQSLKEKQKLSKRTIFATMLILICIPLTLYVGIEFFDKSKFYFIAFCVLIECMLPFFLVFEGRKPKSRELVIIAVLCAIGVAGRAAFFMLPQFKPMAALVIISGIAFGSETGFLVGAITMLTSNMLFSQGPWTPWQMFAMGIIGFLAGIVFRKGFIRRNKISICIFGAISVILIYGGIMNPVSALLWSSGTLNKDILLTYYLTGFPMDLIHAFATFIFLWFAALPMLEKLDRIKVKYGLV